MLWQKKTKKKQKTLEDSTDWRDFLESPGAQFFRGKAHKINLVKLPRRHKAWMKWTAWIYKMSKLCWNTSCSNKPRCIHSSNGSRLPKHSWQKRIDGLSVELGAPTGGKGQISSRPKTRGFTPNGGEFSKGPIPGYFKEIGWLVKYYSIWPHQWNWYIYITNLPYTKSTLHRSFNILHSCLHGTGTKSSHLPYIQTPYP